MIYLKEWSQECEKGFKSVVEEIEDISKETKISRVH